MKRAQFDESLADAIPHQPARKTNHCAANGCPMAGSIDGNCAYHFGLVGMDIPRATSVLNQHHDLRDAINEGRRLLSDAKGDPAMLAGEWRKLRELVAFAGYDVPPAKHHDGLGGWVNRCEGMLLGFIGEARGLRRPAA